MQIPEKTFVNVLLAALPLLLVLYLMMGRRWKGSQAGPVGWAVAAVVAVVWFGAGADLLWVAWGRSVLLALYVLYIIWMALLFYHVVNEAGVIGAMREIMPAFAPDRTTQALLLGWLFASFLQGASGFGVPAAIVAPLLVGLGFAADQSVVMALMGHSWAVTFGSLGSSFLALMAATGLPGTMLASPAATLLGISCLLCGLGTLLIAGGGAALRQRWYSAVGLAAIMAGVQWGLATAGLWTLAAFGAGFAGMVAGILHFRFGWLDRGRMRGEANRAVKMDRGALWSIFFPYLLLVVIIVLGQLALDKPLNAVQLNFTFPQVRTSYGWTTAAGAGRSVSVFGHAGALLLYSSVLAYAWFRRRGTPRGDGYRASLIVRKTVKGSVSSTLAIFTLVAMAVTMQHAGMTQLLAETLSNTGRLFPFLSPFIGALGALMTGSNTNSNVVFAQLQQQTGQALNLALPLILAAQTTGGALGSSFAPAKIIVGCSTVTGADDGRVLRSATAYGLIMITIIGVIVWVASAVG
ncbi:MAG: L-lactate permease [Ardenticatenales bacterium]|nr:L-lactate permease [Ardenticatenales bacterium]